MFSNLNLNNENEFLFIKELLFEESQNNIFNLNENMNNLENIGEIIIDSEKLNGYKKSIIIKCHKRKIIQI